MFYNSSNHMINKVKKLVKKLVWIEFTTPPYSPELNRIEHTFGILKLKIYKWIRIKKN